MDTLSGATPAEDSRRFPLNVRIAAFYLIAWALFGLVFLVFSFGLAYAIYGDAHAGAWALAEGQPSTRILLISYGVVGVWNGLWIFLLWRKARVTSRNEV
jgi:hypothetical protein